MNAKSAGQGVLTNAFFDAVRALIVSARATVARGVDLVQVHTSLEIGRCIVEQEQKGRGQTATKKLAGTRKLQTLSAKSSSNQDAHPFTLSWSHYGFLLGIKNPEERSFYEIEAARQSWAVRELKREEPECRFSTH